MDVNPAIPDRTTEELLEIVETPERWLPDVVAMAQKELMQRGVSIENQELRRKNQSKFQGKIDAIKSRASYTRLEKFLIILLGPVVFLLTLNLLSFRAGEGYKRKNWQGFLYLLLGIALWVIVLAIIFN